MFETSFKHALEEKNKLNERKKTDYANFHFTNRNLALPIKR